ncbi:hypothetical protein [Bifidobacterium avesanii]|uniref:DUF559 domain-containing protein n=1 Tax=Bifidobacterium avesanii TaxID=1798157 RepID=A0A7K3TFW9_9BIFI|nr:hypothetical protein [Bifidobacterium avesanii]KAB8290627.1 hypothetical protein DSM100685_1420 [Bifidobacterium avesanii]NEG77995.1 hypothetical protein [Bifidobacterium avesanii]
MTATAFSLEALSDIKRRRFAACDAIQRRTGRQLVFARSEALELLAVEKPIEPASERLRADADVVVGGVREKTHLLGVRFLTWNGPIETQRIGGDMLCTSPPATWAHYAAILTLEELITLGDSMMRRDGRLTRASLDDFQDYLNRSGRFVGKDNCRLALTMMRPNTDSSQETRTRLALLRYGLPEPEVNVRVRLSSGAVVFLDMAYTELKIAIEYDGGYHRFSGAQVLRDDKRREALENDGWIYIKVTVVDLRDESGEEALAQRIASRCETVLGVPVPLIARLTTRQICDPRRRRKIPLWERVPRSRWTAPWAR